jgi:hypothetical protein
MLVRLADLENWRRDADGWRLRLTGAADTNGRIGSMARDIADLREDVGDSKECQTVREVAVNVRTLQRRAWAAITAAAIAVGGSGWGLVKSRDENIAAAARAEERLDRIERYVDRLLLGPTSTPDPVSSP